MSDHRELVLRAPLGKALWSLSWPLVLANELAVLTISILIFWMDRLLGETGLAVESMFRPLGLMVGWLFGSVGIGAAVLVSRSVGARDGRAMTITVQAIALSGWLWLALVAIAAPLAPWIAGALAAGLPIAEPLLHFLLPWLLLTLPMFTFAEILLDVVSATGWTRFGLVRVVTNLAVIAVLVPVAIDTLGFGVAGAPIAEGVGVVLLAVTLIIAMRRRRVALGLGTAAPRAWRPDWALWRELMAIGLPVSATRTVGFAAQVVLVQLAARESGAAAAAYGIASALVLYGAVISFALSQSCSVIVGQSLGAELPDRARAALRGGLVGALLVAGGFIAVTLAGDHIIAVFTSDPVIAEGAGRALSIMRWGLIGMSVWQVLMMTFAALKLTGRASILTIAADAVGIGFALAWNDQPLVTVSLAFCVASWLKAVVLLVLVRFDRTIASRLGRPRP